MKTVLISLLLCLAAYTENFAQKVNGISLDSLDAEYIQVWPLPFRNRQIQIAIDYGQYNVAFTPLDRRLVDDSGRRLGLDSVMDALNLFSRYGYELAEVYVVSESSAHYILRKKDDERDFASKSY